jgi:hypothetical protein
MSNIDKNASNKRMLREWWFEKDVEESGRGPIVRYYPGICFEGLSKITKTFSRDSQFLDRDLNPELPK